MVSHYFTLQALTRELAVYINGATIEEVFTQQKNELILSLRTVISQEDRDVRTPSLCVSVDPHLSYMFIRESFVRAKKNSADLFRDMVGLSFISIGLHPTDRRIQFMLNNGWRLYVQLYNTAASNVVLTDERNIVLQAFKNNKELLETEFGSEVRNVDDRIFEQEDEFKKALESNEDLLVFARLKQIFPLFGSTYTREILHRARVHEDVRAGLLTDQDKKEIFYQVHRVREETEQSAPVIYFRGNEAKILSVISLQHMSGSESKVFNSVNDAIKTFVQKSFQTNSVEEEKKSLIRNIKAELDRRRRSLDARREQLKSGLRAEEYDRIAVIIMANLQHLTKGTREIELPELHDERRKMRIALDPKLTPAQNAERYFRKAKNAKASVAETEEQISRVAESVRLLEKLLLHLDACFTTEQIKEFKQLYTVELIKMKLIASKAEDERPPFRVFTVEGGLEVWVGKSSANNDLLTMHYSKPNDLWFHVRGAGGSHTVLKVSKSNGQASKTAILQAAGIAAYYSKMRKAGTVPVVYCERKYVRKPKHAESGAVMLDREKTVFVKPELP